LLFFFQAEDGIRDRTVTGVQTCALPIYKRTPCIGRSHGIHAEPTTFGWKLIVWADELARAKARLQRAREIIAVGKLSGAVGTFRSEERRVGKEGRARGWWDDVKEKCEGT